MRDSHHRKMHLCRQVFACGRSQYPSKARREPPLMTKQASTVQSTKTSSQEHNRRLASDDEGLWGAGGWGTPSSSLQPLGLTPRGPGPGRG